MSNDIFNDNITRLALNTKPKTKVSVRSSKKAKEEREYWKSLVAQRQIVSDFGIENNWNCTRKLISDVEVWNLLFF
jgi:hypothetical protein